jgi:hypothetical protein
VEGVGVAPDMEVQRPLPYARGADPVIEAAVDVLARTAAKGGNSRPDGSSTSQ